MTPASAAHLVVVSGPGALPDPGAALEVVDAALGARGATGEVVLTGSADELRAAVARATTDGRECVVVPGNRGDVGADLAAPRGTVVRVDLTDRAPDRSPAVRRHVRGRGVQGLRYAVDAWWCARTRPPTLVHAYGPDPDQHAVLRLPGEVPGSGPGRRGTGAPVAVLVHGGYWRSRWESDSMEPVAVDLARRGWATWNVEYRRPDDHAWDATTADVAAAVQAVADVDAPLDLARDVLLGHSAGGQLVTRLAADVATDPAARVRPAVTVTLAGVLALVDAARRGLGAGAVADALGGPADRRPDVYRASSPIERLPIGSPLAVACAHDDELLSESRAFARAAREAGDDVVVVEGEGDHFAVVDPGSAVWRDVVRVLAERVG